MSVKICPYCAEEIQSEAVKCKHCGSWLDDQFEESTVPRMRRLTRSSRDQMLAGVCGGLARHLELDPTLVRVAFALITIFSALIPGIVTYVVLAIVVPADAEVR